jgi:hypothetical protein
MKPHCKQHHSSVHRSSPTGGPVSGEGAALIASSFKAIFDKNWSFIR